MTVLTFYFLQYAMLAVSLFLALVGIVTITLTAYPDSSAVELELDAQKALR